MMRFLTNAAPEPVRLDLVECPTFRNILAVLLLVYLICHIPTWVWIISLISVIGYMIVTTPGAANLWLDPKKFPKIMKLS